MIHRVVLELNHESGDPGKWDWNDLLDEQVDLISVQEMPELTTAQVNFLTAMLEKTLVHNLGQVVTHVSFVPGMNAEQIIEYCQDAAVVDQETVNAFVVSLENLRLAYGNGKTIPALLPGEDGFDIERAIS